MMASKDVSDLFRNGSGEEYFFPVDLQDFRPP